MGLRQKCTIPRSSKPYIVVFSKPAFYSLILLICVETCGEKYPAINLKKKVAKSKNTELKQNINQYSDPFLGR